MCPQGTSSAERGSSRQTAQGSSSSGVVKAPVLWPVGIRTESTDTRRARAVRHRNEPDTRQLSLAWIGPGGFGSHSVLVGMDWPAWVRIPLSSCWHGLGRVGSDPIQLTSWGRMALVDRAAPPECPTQAARSSSQPRKGIRTSFGSLSKIQARLSKPVFQGVVPQLVLMRQHRIFFDDFSNGVSKLCVISPCFFSLVSL